MTTKFYAVLPVLFITLVAPGCLRQESTADTTQREMDRQKAAADQLESQYARVSGTYSGTFGASEIVLTLDTNRQTASGLVPQPSLVGTLVFTPAILVDGAGQPMAITYPVSSGQFDGSTDLSFMILQNGNPTPVHCRVSNGLNEISCNWYSSAKTNFVLTRLTAGQKLETPRESQFGGSYLGGNSDFSKIRAFFRPFLTTQSGSLATPQLSIVGSFTFYTGDTTYAKFSFTDGEYDPRTSTLVIRINGDNPIVVNCVVRTSRELRCTWIGNHGERSYEEFDLEQESRH